MEELYFRGNTKWFTLLEKPERNFRFLASFTRDKKREKKEKKWKEKGNENKSLTCVRKQRMVIAVIVEFGPHAKSELLYVGQLSFVVNVLGKKVIDISIRQIFLILVPKYICDSCDHY